MKLFNFYQKYLSLGLITLIVSSSVFGVEYDGSTSKTQPDGHTYNCKVTCDDGIIVWAVADPCSASNPELARACTSGRISKPLLPRPRK